MPELDPQRERALRHLLDGTARVEPAPGLADRALQRAARGRRWLGLPLRTVAGGGLTVAGITLAAVVVLASHVAGPGAPVSGVPAGHTGSPKPAPSATATATATSTAVSRTPLPGPGTNLIVNGTFEQRIGSSPVGWDRGGGANVFPGEGRNGGVAVDLVVLPGIPVASLSQQVTIPATAVTAQLGWWTVDYSCGAPLTFTVTVTAPRGVHTVTTIPGAGCGSPWAPHQASLEQFAGQQVTITLGVTSSGGGIGSLFYLDDVSLVVH